MENLPKLMTKEDPYHIHKALGILSLGHFVYRYSCLRYQTMNFTPHNIGWLSVHALLSASSFMFKIPQTRNRIGPMIYPEFRLHNLLFSYRSIVCTLLFYYQYPLIYHVATCYLTMIGADIVTYFYKDGTTIRTIPFDATLTESAKQSIRLFNSSMQAVATLCMIGNIDSAFSVLFAIQISSFLMTLVRKNIISSNRLHFLYGTALLVNVLVYYSLPLSFILYQVTAMYTFEYLRFTRNYNKYACWTFLFLMYSIHHKIIPTLSYETTIKTLLILKFAYTNVPTVLLCYNM